MKKQQWLALINPLLFLLIAWQAGTAILSAQIGDELFPTVHVLTGYALVVVALLHTWLNWDWIALKYFGKKAKRTSDA
jgi:hypothetical protein